MKKILLAAALLALGSPAFAAPLTWNIVNTTFIGGGTLTGSFVYDATTNTYSNLNITASASGGFALTTFTFVDPTFPGTSTGLFPDSATGILSGTPALNLLFGAALTNAGGSVAILNSSMEGMCIDAACLSANSLRPISSGSVVSGVPEPATVGMLGLGLVALAFVKRRTVRT